MTDTWDGAAEAAAKKEKAEKLADTVTWKPRDGFKKKKEEQVLVGVLVDAKIVSGNFGPTIVLNIEDDDDVVWTVWAGDSLLRDALSLEEKPALSHRVRLTYTGKQKAKKPGGYDYHMWAVEAQETDPDFWDNMSLEGPRNEPLAAAADGMEDPF